jgi:serine/threonine protein kinase/Flp pilus assembly protein TadD
MTAERNDKQPPRAPSASDAAGEFTEAGLAASAASQATGEFGPEAFTPPASQATGEFQVDGPPDDSMPTAVIRRPAAPPPASDVTGEFTFPGDAQPGQAGNLSAIATGEFHVDDAPAGADTHRGRGAGQATGQVPGRHTNAGAGPRPGRGQGGKVGHYEKMKFHAAGGMGEVWRAEDPAINRPVALKKMRPGMEGMTERFLLEAQITGQLEHPGVVPVHELGEDENGQPYYAMRFIHGRTLQKAIEHFHKATTRAGGPDEVGHLRLLQVFLNLCQTVAYAHSRSVLHRDLKPENVMVGEYGETLLLDWGLAKVIGNPDVEEGQMAEGADVSHRSVHLTFASEDTKTVSGAIKGTPGYMSPEAAEGANDKVDQVSDVYLLGATLYHILTGQAPRSGDKLINILNDARNKQPPAPRSINPFIPVPLDAICQKAMAFRKEDRYQSAQALADDLQRYLAGEPVEAYQETFLERTWRWMKKHRQALTWAAAGLAVLAVVTFGLWKWRQLEAGWAEERRIAQEKQEETEKERKEAQEKADLAQKQDEARKRLAKFHRLADETRFYAAIPAPAGEQAPAFHDMENAESRGREALALVADWGPSLDGLPLEQERPAVRDDMADLLLLLAQTRARRAADANGARAVLALLKQAAPLRPASASNYRLSAQAFRLLGDKKRADEDQRRADSSKTPRTAADHFLLGMAYQNEAARTGGADDESDAGKAAHEKRVKRAIEQYRAALRLEPNHYWAHLQLGSSQLALGQPAQAAEALNACVALRPKAPWGYAVRGMALMIQKEFDAAAVDLDRAIALSPEFRLPQINRGIAYWVQKKYDKALDDFNAVLRPPQQKRLIEGAYYKGQVHLERDQYKEALAAFDEVVAARRNFPSLHIFRARCLLCLGDQKKALAALDLFLDDGRSGYDAKSPEAHGQRGRLLRVVLVPKLPPAAKKQALLLAFAQLTEAAKGDTAPAVVHEDLGAIQELMGQTAKAIESYTESLRRNPKDIKTRVKRGWARADLMPPNYEGARDDFVEVLRLDTKHAEAYTGLGYMQACLKKTAEARRAASQALLHGAGDYIILHNVACIYAKLAQADDKQAKECEDIAIDLLRRAVELWRNGTGPSELLMIRREPSFHKALRDRPEFRKLLGSEA